MQQGLELLLQVGFSPFAVKKFGKPTTFYCWAPEGSQDEESE
jgi:hypothetical protein